MIKTDDAQRKLPCIVCFNLQVYGAALIWRIILWGLILYMILTYWKVDKTAALL